MPSALTQAELLERQRTDQKMLGALDVSDCPISISGHRSAEDARTDRNPVPFDDRNPATHYRVTYDLDTLVGPGKRHRPTTVHVAPLANGGYPASAPSAWVISDRVPWTPHFAANVPICHGGHVWIPYRTQLVDYVVHLGKLLNFDEPPPAPGYHGYNGHAITYWRDQMGLKPLDPDLRFPRIHAEDVISVGRFKAATASSPTNAIRFGPATPSGGRFKAAQSHHEGRFAPARSRS
jgi:hypothetical protein